jgi:DUF4097 and DUF4098 domain-containing protein YvlB
MILYKKHLSLSIFFCIYHISAFSFNPKKLIDNLWQKTEQEYLHKDMPLTDLSTVEMNTCEGKILVKTWTQPKIVIEAEKIGTAAQLKGTTIGIKKQLLEAKTTHITITTHTIPDQQAALVNYTIMVPEHCSLIIRCADKGQIKVKSLYGTLDVSLGEGDIDIADTTKSVSAKTGKGTIKLKQKKFSDADSVFLENGRGNIALYLPRETKARLHARTLAGTVSSEHPVTQTYTAKWNKDTWARIKKEVDGTLGTEIDTAAKGPITLEATKGDISIEEY